MLTVVSYNTILDKINIVSRHYRANAVRYHNYCFGSSQPFNGCIDLPFSDRVETSCRLIKKNYLSLRQQCTCYRKALSFTSR